MTIDPRRDYQFYYAEIDGAAGAATVQYQVPAGCTARIVAAVGYHDHAGDLTCRWRINDTLGDIHELCVGTTVGSGGRLSLYAACAMAESLVMRNPWILEWNITGLAGGEHGFILLVAEIRKGDTSYT